MRVANTLPRTPLAQGVPVGQMLIGANPAIADAARSTGLSEQLRCLLQQASTCFETDSEAARQCLRDAADLLGSSSGSDVPEFLPEGSSMHGGLARWQVRRTLTHIEVNLASKITILELADLVAFSRSHFSRAFKQSLRLSPMSYVVTRRIERAKLLMSSSNEQLSDIALACGFADQSHLNRSFRRLVGISPGSWRRRYADFSDVTSPVPVRAD